MGQIIYIEEIEIEREKELRGQVLRQFPWTEMDMLEEYLIAPIIEPWSQQQKTIVKEAVFRLVYEAYILGLLARERKKARQVIRKNSSLQISSLAQDVMDAFMMFRWFDYHKRKSLRMLFISLAEEWYLRGQKSTSILR